MKRITKRDLITYCRRCESEVCNECEYFDNACKIFQAQTGEIPYWADEEEMTEEVIEWTETTT